MLTDTVIEDIVGRHLRAATARKLDPIHVASLRRACAEIAREAEKDRIRAYEKGREQAHES